MSTRFARASKKFDLTAREFEEFVHEHKRMPSATGEDPSEDRLARWIAKKRWEERAGRLDPRRSQVLDGIDPNWRATTHSEQGFARELSACARWVEEHRGRLPSLSSADPDERFHAVWLNGRRYDRKVGRLTRERERALDRELPTWRTTEGSELWFEAKLRMCAEQFRRSAGSGEHVGWLANRRRELRDGRLRADRRAALDRTIPGWDHGIV